MKSEEKWLDAKLKATRHVLDYLQAISTTQVYIIRYALSLPVDERAAYLQDIQLFLRELEMDARDPSDVTRMRIKPMTPKEFEREFWRGGVFSDRKGIKTKA